MPVSITFTGTAKEVIEEMMDLLGAEYNDSEVAAKALADAAAYKEDNAAREEMQAKRTRKAKAAEAPKVEIEEMPKGGDELPTSMTPLPTLDEMKALLSQVNDKHGYEAATKLVKKFAPRLSEIALDEDILKFVAEAKALVA